MLMWPNYCNHNNWMEMAEISDDIQEAEKLTAVSSCSLHLAIMVSAGVVAKHHRL